jgi:hypothetical protein
MTGRQKATGCAASTTYDNVLQDEIEYEKREMKRRYRRLVRYIEKATPQPH